MTGGNHRYRGTIRAVLCLVKSVVIAPCIWLHVWHLEQWLLLEALRKRHKYRCKDERKHGSLLLLNVCRSIAPCIHNLQVSTGVPRVLSSGFGSETTLFCRFHIFLKMLWLIIVQQPLPPVAPPIEKVGDGSFEGNYTADRKLFALIRSRFGLLAMFLSYLSQEC